MGGDKRRIGTRPGAVLLVLWIALIMGGAIGGCASKAPGVIHHVQPGENLYRIGLRYQVDPERIAKVNGIRDVTTLSVGQRLFIPGVAKRRTGSASPGLARGEVNPNDVARAREQAKSAARQQTSLKFMWPARGRLSSRFGLRRGRPHDGIDVAASRGTPIYAAESGRVIHSGRMGGYGKVVIVKHAGAYRTVYAHASRLVVKKGAFVERGQKIAEVGSTGRSTGPHVHFEIRRSETPQNPLGFLP